MSIGLFTRAFTACLLVVMLMPGLLTAANNIEGYGTTVEETYEGAVVNVSFSADKKGGLLYVSPCPSCSERILQFNQNLEIHKGSKITNDLSELSSIHRSLVGVIFNPVTKTARAILLR